jgi:MFS family permease
MLTYRGRHRLDSSRLGRRFNLFWTGQAVSQVGDKVAYLSIPLFVVFLSDRSFDLAITYTLDTLPMLLVGFFGGVLLDRLRLRPLMIAADLLRASAFFFLAWIAADGRIESPGGRLAVVFVITFLAGTLAVTFGNALYTLLPALVSRQDLATANGRIAASEYAALAVGPILAGFLVGVVGFWPTFVLNGLTFVVSAATLTALGPVDVEREHSSRGVLGDALHGLHYVWSEIRLRLVTSAAALGNFVVGFIESTFVILADEVGATTNLD